METTEMYLVLGSIIASLGIVFGVFALLFTKPADVRRKYIEIDVKMLVAVFVVALALLLPIVALK